MQSIKQMFIILMKILIILVTIILLVIGIFMYVFNIVPTSDGYDRAIYEVVLYNNTTTVINGIEILYGDNSKNHYTMLLYDTIYNIQPHEYRKVQIYTQSPSIEPPYNVYVHLTSQEENNVVSTGYFGINTGGFSLININAYDNSLYMTKAKTTSFQYKKAYWKHRRKQNELIWY